jgi:hypothetical protein
MKFYTKDGILPNQGFVKPKIDRTQYVKGDGRLGVGELLMPGGHGWVDYIPELERQNEFFETMHCTVFNTLNPIESLAKIKYGEVWDKSERYNGVLGGLTPNGGSPHYVAESIRKFGVIEQASLPWTPDLNSFWKYSAPRPMSLNHINEGKQWLRQYSFGHDWVIASGNVVSQTARAVGEFFNFISTPEALIDALQYSPLGIAVLAWRIGPDGLAYKNRYEVDNHWTVLVDFEWNKYWLVRDSYRNEWIKLRWDYPISFAKRYSLEKTNADETDAEYIKTNYYTKNVKGDKTSTVYFVYSDKKHPYPNMVEYEKICDRWFVNRDFITVSQSALDLIEEGPVMSYDRIASIKPFSTIVDSVKK